MDYVENLTDKEKSFIDGKLQNYIPWRVWNENSISTSCRLVFDASHKTSRCCSLNSLRAKGVNSMNSLLSNNYSVDCASVYHCDISSFYNLVLLNVEYWRYQLYWWGESLDVERPPRQKVVKTLMENDLVVVWQKKDSELQQRTPILAHIVQLIMTTMWR